MNISGKSLLFSFCNTLLKQRESKTMLGNCLTKCRFSMRFVGVSDDTYSLYPCSWPDAGNVKSVVLSSSRSAFVEMKLATQKDHEIKSTLARSVARRGRETTPPVRNN